MPTPWQPNCLRLLIDIAKDLGAIRASINETQKWPVPRMEDLIDKLSTMRGTNLVGSATFGYLEKNEQGIDMPARFPCYEEAILSMLESAVPPQSDIETGEQYLPKPTESPLDELQTLVETELYSKGNAWYSLEEKRAEIVDPSNAKATLAEFDSYWKYTVDHLISWHETNPVIHYRRPYAQAVR